MKVASTVRGGGKGTPSNRNHLPYPISKSNAFTAGTSPAPSKAVKHNKAVVRVSLLHFVYIEYLLVD